MSDPVTDQLRALGDLVVGQFDASMASLAAADLAQADTVVRNDLAVNELRYAIESRITDDLAAALQPPERLRLLLATLSVINDLERIGDHCEGIAKVALMLGADQPYPLPTRLAELGHMVGDMLRRGVAAFAGQQEQDARRLCTEDDAVDSLYDVLYGELLAAMTSDTESVAPRTYMLWAIHNLERIADRVTNICERTVYLATGRIEELNVSNY